MRGHAYPGVNLLQGFEEHQVEEARLRERRPQTHDGAEREWERTRIQDLSKLRAVFDLRASSCCFARFCIVLVWIGAVWIALVAVGTRHDVLKDTLQDLVLLLVVHGLRPILSQVMKELIREQVYISIMGKSAHADGD